MRALVRIGILVLSTTSTLVDYTTTFSVIMMSGWGREGHYREQNGSSDNGKCFNQSSHSFLHWRRSHSIEVIIPYEIWRSKFRQNTIKIVTLTVLLVTNSLQIIAHLIFVNYKLSDTLITPPYLTHANQSCAFFYHDHFNCCFRYVVNLQQSFQINLPAKICHNLTNRQDHLVFNASLAFPPKTWTAGFQRSFFVSVTSDKEKAARTNLTASIFLRTLPYNHSINFHQTHRLTWQTPTSPATFSVLVICAFAVWVWAGDALAIAIPIAAKNVIPSMHTQALVKY